MVAHITCYQLLDSWGSVLIYFFLHKAANLPNDLIGLMGKLIIWIPLLESHTVVCKCKLK